MSKRTSRKLNFFAVCLICLPMVSLADDSPSWAYPVNPPDFKPSPDKGALRQVPDSSEQFSTPQVRDRFFSPDWHPADHPQMPSIVAGGRKPDVFSCGYCHRAEGTGGPENASIAGLSPAYILQQIANFKSGARSTAVPKRGPTNADDRRC